MKAKQKKGFALWDKEKIKKVASLGGIMAHKIGKAHEYTSEEGRLAGSMPKKRKAKK